MKIFRQCLRMLFVFVLLLFFFSCDFHLYDPDKPKPGYLDEMPKETSIGANTFGCYVNGELAATQGYYQNEGIKPGLYFGWMPPVNGYWMKENNNQIMYLGIDTKTAGFDFQLENDIHLGENECKLFYLYLRKYNASRIIEGVTIDIFKIDTIERIISGQFDDINLHMRPLFADTSVFVSVTNGQFDIKYGQNY